MEREHQIPLDIEDPKKRKPDHRLPYRPKKEEEPKGDLKLEQLGQLPITEITENSDYEDSYQKEDGVPRLGLFSEFPEDEKSKKSKAAK